jgi:hypothetical protein
VRVVLLDLRGDPRWHALAAARRVVHVPLTDSAFWTNRGDDAPIVLDARGRHTDGVALLARLPHDARKRRILLTDRDSPLEHAAAYDAGATEIIVASLGEMDPTAVLERLARGDV